MASPHLRERDRLSVKHHLCENARIVRPNGTSGPQGRGATGRLFSLSPALAGYSGFVFPCSGELGVPPPPDVGGGMTHRHPHEQKGEMKGGGRGCPVARHFFSAALLFPLPRPNAAPSFRETRQSRAEPQTPHDAGAGGFSIKTPLMWLSTLACCSFFVDSSTIESTVPFCAPLY